MPHFGMDIIVWSGTSSVYLNVKSFNSSLLYGDAANHILAHVWSMRAPMEVIVFTGVSI